MGAQDRTQVKEIDTELAISNGDDEGSAFDLKATSAGQLAKSMNGAVNTHTTQEQVQNHQNVFDNTEARLQVPTNQNGPSAIERSEEDDPQSRSDIPCILVLVSKRCLTEESAVDGPHFLRINDERGPFGMFLLDNLFDMSRTCKSCAKPEDAHVHCYIHRKGKLTVSVEKIETPLSSESDGRIWMWHSCSKCPLSDGGPPTTPRVRMSEADWGLSFRKFLELSFSTNEKSTTLAACGHSLGRECIRFYGRGNMVACFRFSEISVLSIYLPPLKLEVNHAEQEANWLQAEVDEVTNQGNSIFAEVVQHFRMLQQQITSARKYNGSITAFEALRRILSLEERLLIEKNIFKEGLTRAASTYESGQTFADILELNWLRRQLFNYAALWERRLEYLRSKVLCSLQLGTDLDDDMSPSVSKEINTEIGNATQVDDPKFEEELSRRIERIIVSHSVTPNVVQSTQHKQVPVKSHTRPEETSCGGQDANENVIHKRQDPARFSGSPDGNGANSQSVQEVDLFHCYGKPLDQIEPAHLTLGGSGFRSASVSASERLTGLTSFISSEKIGRIKSRDGYESRLSPDLDDSGTTPTRPLETHVTPFRAFSEGSIPLLADLGNAGDVPWTEDGRSADTDGHDKLTGEFSHFSLTRDGHAPSAEGFTGDQVSQDYSSSGLAQEGDSSACTEDAVSDTKAVTTGTQTKSDGSEDNPGDGWMRAFFEKLFKSNRRASPSMATGSDEIIFPPKHSSILLRAAALAGDGGPKVFLSGGHDDCVVAVYDDEPTTIIAYALTTEKHHVHVTDVSGKDHLERDETKGSDHFRSDQAVAVAFPIQGTESVAEVESMASEESFTSDGGSLRRVESIENLLISRESSETAKITISFNDETPQVDAKFQVICYFAKQFDELRKKWCMGNKDYIRSLCRCKKWDAQGGKSKAFFARTADERFIVKQMTRTELTSFVGLASSYFKYLFEALTAGNPTCLAKIFGVYEVKVVKDGKETKMDVLVMENLLYGRHASRTYDLKGSMRSRYNADTGKDQVLLDENLVEILRTNPIYIGENAKHSLECAIWNDTFFLSQVKVMDYSLLLGVDEERQELVVGIIDFIGKYTWDKQLENWVKATGILGGPKNVTPTVISPKQYKKRFRKAIAKYFLMVPDDWASTSDITLRSSTESVLTEEDVIDDALSLS